MADIVIRGMEMPKEGKPVAIIIRSDGEVWLIDWDNTVYTGYAACWPTTPMKASALPEGHGRLIDADALLLDAGEVCEVWGDGFATLGCSRDKIKNAPTIVPAEGGKASEKPV